VVSLFLLAALPSAAQEGGRRVKERAEPVLPELARQMNLSGAVRLQITILPSGSVRDVKVLGGHPLLADAAVRAVQTWKWDVGREEVKTLIIDFKK
jgi:TonB family protein